jgi:hypothetical protein
MPLPIQRFALAFLLAAALPVSAAAGSDEDPRALRAAEPAPESQPKPRAVLPTGGTGLVPVYFVPQDNDANATVIFLYNTSADDASVDLSGYSSNGVLVYHLVLDVPAGGFTRLVSDAVAAAPPPSWDAAAMPTPAPVVVTNFTDFTYYARFLLPAGLHVDGFIEYNPGTGVVDPRATNARVPLHFSVGTAP